MGAVIPFDKAPVPAHIAAAFQGQTNSELMNGGANIPSLTYRGKVWRFSVNGEETDVLDEDGQPQTTVNVILIKANPARSKTYHKGKYVEGDSSPPVCYSFDGVKPAPSVSEKQADSCAACPHNVLGSRITEDGKKAKACQDRKRLVVMPEDLSLQPLLLNLAPTSTYDRDNKANEAKGFYALTQYGEMLQNRGVKYQAVVTKLGFDSSKAYPKLLFKAVRFLNEEELAKVLALQDDPVVTGLLDGTFVTAAAPVEEAEEFEQTAPEIAPAPPAKPKAAAKPAPKAEPEPAQEAPPPAKPKAAAKPAPKPVVKEADDDIEAALAEILGSSDDDDGGDDE